MLVKVLESLVSAVTVLSLYRFFYALIGLLTKAKTFPETDARHTFGIVIAARNEAAVIGRLLDSISAQDYDPDRFRVFVVADNCTDDTAEICRTKGAVVYERRDPSHARKGYALRYLFDRIDRDFGIDCVDGYVVFDADNLLAPDFLTEMNRAFDTGADICVGYRNTKNFSENAISAAYGIHFLRSSAIWHRPRGLLGLSTHIAGTGWAVRSELLRDGWDCTLLTEDTQFTMQSVADSRRIVYCEAAEFYDEQPHELATAVRQRTRWIKGRLACFLRYARRLICGVFAPGNSFSVRLSCFDMFFYLFPAGLFTALCGLVTSAAGLISGAVSPMRGAGGAPVWDTLLMSLAAYWAFTVLTGAAVAIRERKHIRCGAGRLVFYLLVWPWFDLLDVPLAILSLFRHVEWTPIKHDRSLTLDEVKPGHLFTK